MPLAGVLTTYKSDLEYSPVTEAIVKRVPFLMLCPLFAIFISTAIFFSLMRIEKI